MSTAWNRRDLLFAGAAAPLAAAAASQPEFKLPKDIKVGMIGFEGHFGEAVHVARMSPQVTITAYEISNEREVSRSKNLKELAQATRYDDYRKLLKNEELDAVCICDQNWRRAESVIACLEAGVATAAEKPIALSIADTRRVQAAAEKTGTPLTMLLPMRFDPAYVVMKQIVDRGEIGDAVQLSGQKSYQLGQRPEWMMSREKFGGTIPYIACHTVDLLRFISGRDMVATAAFHANVGFPHVKEMENTAAISYQLDNGGTADVRLDYLRPEAGSSHGDDRLRIAGTDGVIEYIGGEVTLMTDSKPKHVVTERPVVPSLFANFLDTVYNGAESMLKQEELFRVTEIVLRSREAADSGRVVRI